LDSFKTIKRCIFLYLQKHKQLEDLKPLVAILEQEGLLSTSLESENQDIYAKNIADFMFSDYFNFLPSNRYIEAALSLDVSYIIRNDIGKMENNISPMLF